MGGGGGSGGGAGGRRQVTVGSTTSTDPVISTGASPQYIIASNQVSQTISGGLAIDTIAATTNTPPNSVVDTFLYARASDAPPATEEGGTPETVLNYQEKDIFKLDISKLTAPTSGIVGGTAAPYSVWVQDVGGFTCVFADTTGDTAQDFAVKVAGMNNQPYTGKIQFDINGTHVDWPGFVPTST